MTRTDFLAKVSGYYGAAYPPGQRADIAQWMHEVEEPILPALWEAVKRTQLYGKPLPLVADLEDALERAREEVEATPRRVDGPLPRGLEYNPEECVSKAELLAWTDRIRTKFPLVAASIGRNLAADSEAE